MMPGPSAAPVTPLTRERRSVGDRRTAAVPVTCEARKALGRRNDPSPLLREAAQEVAAAWAGNGAETLPQSEVHQLLQTIVEAVLQALVGGSGPNDPRLCTVLGQRLLGRLRAAVIRRWAGGDRTPPSHSILAVLGAFDVIGEQVESQQFGSRLSGTDGLGLVVQVAHDFRSPLSAVLFLADLLLKGRSGRMSRLQHRQLGLIYSATLGMSELASNVIEMARDANRLADDHVSAFSIAETLESVRTLVGPIAEEKAVAIKLCPPAHDERVGHPKALSRALLNLTTNALRFTEKGWVEITAREISPTRLQFAVRDTGRGIDASQIQTLFDPFRRTPEGDRYVFSATGLGLNLCRRLVEMMGSELKVESRRGSGTRFFFELEAPPA
jgi:signal transduction histidine kinase